MAERVTIDDEVCAGHGRCYMLAPDVFTDDERGHGVVVEPLVDGALLEQARLGEENCPEGAVGLGEG